MPEGAYQDQSDVQNVGGEKANEPTCVQGHGRLGRRVGRGAHISHREHPSRFDYQRLPQRLENIDTIRNTVFFVTTILR